MGPLVAAGRFHPWSQQHVLVLLVTCAGLVGVVASGRRHRGTPRELPVRRTAAAVSLALVAASQVDLLLPGVRTMRNSWPLQLSDLAEYTAVYALWTRGSRSAAFTYYVGFTLTLSSLLTPALTQPFPDPRWFAFWFRHVLVLWAAAYLVWGLGVRPAWRLYRSAVTAALAWMVLTYGFDVVTGTNYGYLREKPAVTTPLSLLGPWPWYVLVAMAILLGTWAVVMTLPWERRTR